jgi:hypothetical protein
MTWGQACKAMINGHKVRRKWWAESAWWALQPEGCKPRALRDDLGLAVYPINDAHLAATDWEVIPNETTT